MSKWKAGNLSPTGTRPDENKKSTGVEAEESKETKEPKEDEETQPTLEEELKSTKELADDNYARLQRLQADFDNYRKRSVKEKADVIRYATENLILDILPVIDNFERAIAAVAASHDFEALANGVEMIYRQLLKVLEDEGVEVIVTEGQEFEPNLHEALLREEVAGKEPEMILEEFEKGYRLKDKVIRYSKVKVSG